MICTKGEMFDLMAETIAMLEYDLDAEIITWASKPLEAMFGYSLRGELEGQPVEMLIPESRRASHKKHRSGYAKHPEARTMGAMMGVQLPLEGKRQDGSIFPVAVLLNPGVAGLLSLRKRIVVAIVLNMTSLPIPGINP